MAYTEMIVTAATKTKHVNNVKLLDYLDQARNHWYRISFENGAESVVVHMETDFKKEVFDGDQLAIVTELDRIGNTSYTLLQRISGSDGVLHVISKTVMATIDKETRLKTPVPYSYRSLMEFNGSLLEAGERSKCVAEAD